MTGCGEGLQPTEKTMTPEKEYRQLFPDWATHLDAIPQRMRGGFCRYVMHGVMPGHFLTCVLENDLKGAVTQADLENVKLLHEYVSLVMHGTPIAAQGSPEAVSKWCADGGVLGASRSKS